MRSQTTSYAYVVVTLYFFSGITALSYEVLWARMLSLQFGVSIFGVIVTVAAFMLGLGIGSLSMARMRTSMALLWFAGLEASVAVFALFLPAIMTLVDGIIAQFGADISLTMWYFYQVSGVLLLLFFPACALGATFPLVLRALRKTSIRPATLYGINTFGGAVGALLPLLLLPLLGWTRSVLWVATLGFVIAIFALILFFRTRAKNGTHNAKLSEESELETKLKINLQGVQSLQNKPGLFSSIEIRSYWAYAGIGLAALTLEISWTRLFGMILLRTEYVMAIILAVFLVGIAFGSLWGRRLHNPRWLVLFPILAALSALLSLWGLATLAAWSANASFSSLISALLMQGLAIGLLTLPTTLLFGAWFPLLNVYLSETTGITAARLYGSNAIGAASGAMLSGFVFMPWLGSNATIVLASVLLLICGFVWVTQQHRLMYGLASIALVLFALPVLNLPAVNVLLPATQQDTHDIYRFEDAISMTHVIQNADGQRLLLGDLQRLDASSEPAAVSSQLEQARLPLLLHPEPKSVLFLGIGTGISASGSLPFPNLERTGVELSRGAIVAAKDHFSSVNSNVTQKMRIVRDDVRRYLRRHQESFDVIIGDLFHPDLVGRSALLSLQQFTRVRARLQPQGLFVQWLALQQFDRQNLQVVLRTFEDVFPRAVLFVDGFKLAMVGPKDAWGGANDVLSNIARLDESLRQQVVGREGVWTRLGRYFGPIASSPGPIQDEWRPVIEFSLPRLRYAKDSDLLPLLLWLMDRRPDVGSAMLALNVGSEYRDIFEAHYTASGLAIMSWISGISGDLPEAYRLIRFANRSNPNDRLVALDLADKMYASLSQATAAGISRREALQRILAIYPDHEATLREMWRLAIKQGDNEARDQYKRKLLEISPLSQVLFL
ncbi:MAG: fused MFS/spermidine synthase [Thiohalomonadales bacterium]